CELMEGAMAAGAIGLSTSYVDIDENLRPVPSRLADMREKTALCRAMAKSGRGTLQTVPYLIDPEQQLKNIEELGELSLATGVFWTIAPIVYNPAGPDNYKRDLAKLDEQRARRQGVWAIHAAKLQHQHPAFGDLVPALWTTLVERAHAARVARAY